LAIFFCPPDSLNTKAPFVAGPKAYGYRVCNEKFEHLYTIVKIRGEILIEKLLKQLTISVTSSSLQASL